MSINPRRSPWLRIAALLTASTLALTACGQAEDPETPETPAETTTEGGETAEGTETAENGEGTAKEDISGTIRFSWWGSDARHQMNQALIEKFNEEYPNITVTPDFTDWGGYWDKLATQTAGGDTPDVIMQEERYLREYAEKGVLANLNDYDIDTSQIDESLLGSGEFNDGLWGIPTGVNVRVMMADPQAFEEAGMEMPDDENWTWEEYQTMMAELTEKLPAGSYGSQDFGFIEPDLSIWLRQRGEALWNEDGEIGFDAATMAELWEYSMQTIDTGGAPPVSEGLELTASGPEQSLIATNRGAIARYWTNQLGAISGAAGRDLVLLRYPGETEFDRSGLFLKPAMALSMSAKSESPEAAALFIDWMLNSPEAGEIILSDRGLPANMEVREHIMDQLSDAEKQAATFIEEVTPTIVDAPAAPPAGAGQVADLMARINEEVLFGQTSPADAAERFISEASNLTGS